MYSELMQREVTEEEVSNAAVSAAMRWGQPTIEEVMAAINDDPERMIGKEALQMGANSSGSFRLIKEGDGPREWAEKSARRFLGKLTKEEQIEELEQQIATQESYVKTLQSRLEKLYKE